MRVRVFPTPVSRFFRRDCKPLLHYHGVVNALPTGSWVMVEVYDCGDCGSCGDCD